jgi:bzd-type benzoyl-CoA reductase N subunit
MEDKTKPKALKIFFEAANNLVNPLLTEWSEQGGKILGYYCSYVPEELITAAGLMPFRIRATGSTTTELADAYLTHLNCSFIRHSFDMALRGNYGFIEGVVLTSCCDHARRVYDNWKRYIKDSFIHFLALPRKSEETQVSWYRDELKNLKDHLEDHFDVKITDDKIQEAIKIHNETRALQRELYNLRKQKNPPITGAETLAVIVAGTAIPKAQYNALLKELLNDLRERKIDGDYRARLMILGGILDDPAYLDVIEEQGGLIVADTLCFGSKIFWEKVKEDEDDPLMALARYHIADSPSCPHTVGVFPQRANFVKDMVKDFDVDGIIAQRMQFCDNWGYESKMLADVMKEEGIPFLRLEKEYLLSSVGQLRTRIQAFLETLEGGI